MTAAMAAAVIDATRRTPLVRQRRDGISGARSVERIGSSEKSVDKFSLPKRSATAGEVDFARFLGLKAR
jgi:hypothetical protein